MKSAVYPLRAALNHCLSNWFPVERYPLVVDLAVMPYYYLSSGTDVLPVAVFDADVARRDIVDVLRRAASVLRGSLFLDVSVVSVADYECWVVWFVVE